MSRYCLVLAIFAAISGSVYSAEPAHAQMPSCLVGQWNASDLDETFKGVFANIPNAQIDRVGGDVVLLIQPSGAYEIRYVGLIVYATLPTGPSAMAMDGPLKGRMQEIQPGIVVGSINESDVTSTATILGVSTTNEILFQGQSPTGSPVDYDCDGNWLSFIFNTPRTGQQFSFTFVR